MGIVREAADSAAASSAKVATAGATAAYSFTSLPLSSIAAGVSIVVSLVYFWGALPRLVRTVRAFYRGVVKHDWADWKALSNQPMQGED